MENNDDNVWDAVVSAANSIRRVLDDKPSSLKIGFRASPGGILSAYREGDLSFKEAVEAIEKLVFIGNKMAS